PRLPGERQQALPELRELGPGGRADGQRFLGEALQRGYASAHRGLTYAEQLGSGTLAAGLVQRQEREQRFGVGKLCHRPSSCITRIRLAGGCGSGGTLTAPGLTANQGPARPR